MYMVRGLYQETATHRQYTYDSTINMSAVHARSAQDRIWLGYFCRMGLTPFSMIEMLVRAATTDKNRETRNATK
jgi:hypothetical protein